MSKEVILLNGPPNCGKDTVADVLVKHIIPAQKLMFKEALYEATAEFFNMPLDHLVDDASDRDKKEEPNIWLGVDAETIYASPSLLKTFGDYRPSGVELLSPRQALIYVSEDEIKPREGKDYFGKKTAEKLAEGTNIISDSGFKEESIAIIDVVGAENVYHVHLYRDGCEFTYADSRSYFDMVEYGVTPVDFYNNEEINETNESKFVDFFIRKIEKWKQKEIPLV